MDWNQDPYSRTGPVSSHSWIIFLFANKKIVLKLLSNPITNIGACDWFGLSIWKCFTSEVRILSDFFLETLLCLEQQYQGRKFGLSFGRDTSRNVTRIERLGLTAPLWTEPTCTLRRKCAISQGGGLLASTISFPKLVGACPSVPMQSYTHLQSLLLNNFDTFDTHSLQKMFKKIIYTFFGFPTIRSQSFEQNRMSWRHVWFHYVWFKRQSATGSLQFFSESLEIQGGRQFSFNKWMVDCKDIVFIFNRKADLRLRIVLEE